MLQALDLLESRHWVKQLHSHRSQYRSSMQEEEITAAARMLDCVLYEIDDSVGLEFRAVPEAEITCRYEEKREVYMSVIITMSFAYTQDV